MGHTFIAITLKFILTWSGSPWYYTILHRMPCHKLTFIYTGMSNYSTQPTTKGCLLKYASLSQHLETSCHKRPFYIPSFIHFLYLIFWCIQFPFQFCPDYKICWIVQIFFTFITIMIVTTNHTFTLQKYSIYSQLSSTWQQTETFLAFKDFYKILYNYLVSTVTRWTKRQKK